MPLSYLHYDVFTDTAFEGNQLAVFPEPQGLSTEQMQTILNNPLAEPFWMQIVATLDNPAS